MSREGFFKRRVFPVLFMLGITLVFIAVTTIIYTYSKDTIAFNEALRARRAILYAAGVPVPESPQETDRLYNEMVAEVAGTDENTQYYLVRGGQAAKKLAVIVTRGPGLWGTITMAIGYDRASGTITGIEIIDQNETPGLGGRIGEEWFKEQFRNKRHPLALVGEGETATDSEFQAITGATYSSQAIRDIVNRASADLTDTIE